jgi:adenylate kinase
MGAPGSGKGTCAVELKSFYGIPHISTGEMFRKAIQDKTPLGVLAQQLIDKGHFVPDDITNQLVKERLSQDDCKKGFILDGYPRHMPQVYAVEEILEELNLKVDYALVLNVDYETALKRTIGRQICPNCKQTYNRLTGVNAPLVENMCNDCNVELTKRNDDNEETLKVGYNFYLENTIPVVEYFRNKGILIELDASGSPEDTMLQLQKVIGSKND